MNTSAPRLGFWKTLSTWIASPSTQEPADQIARNAGGSYAKVDWFRNMPFFFMHAGCLGVIWAGFSWTAMGVALGLYVLRMFFITAFYHRYFSHRTFRASRAVQCAMAICGLTAVQRGPLWWAAHHRHHHQHSDQEEDLHSPTFWGVMWSHMFWFTTSGALPTRSRYVRDLEKFPELVWLDRHETVVYVAFAVACFGLGCLLSVCGWNDDLHWFHAGIQMLVWCFFISTILLYHGTYTINSLSHLYGSRRFETPDTSRNNWLLSIVTMGEGWHNNHHHYQSSVRQGFYWWEWDPTYYALKAMSAVGLVRDLRGVPKTVLNQAGRGGKTTSATALSSAAPAPTQCPPAPAQA